MMKRSNKSKTGKKRKRMKIVPCNNCNDSIYMDVANEKQRVCVFCRHRSNHIYLKNKANPGKSHWITRGELTLSWIPQAPKDKA